MKRCKYSAVFSGEDILDMMLPYQNISNYGF
jgi:hypothetical protein